MPQELRTIIFDPTEVSRAMTAFASRQNTPMPAGTVESVAFDADNEPALLLTMKPVGSLIAQRIAFRKAEVAAALILLCRDLRVPLPKECRKELVSREGRPAFQIELT